MYNRVKVDDSFWTLEDGKEINIALQKVGMQIEIEARCSLAILTWSTDFRLLEMCPHFCCDKSTLS